MAFGAETVAAVGTAGVAVAQGERQRRVQKRALAEQQDAQRVAAERLATQQRRTEQEQARRTGKRPDVAGLLAKAQASPAVSKTLLTGVNGAQPGKLAKPALLGG